MEILLDKSIKLSNFVKELNQVKSKKMIKHIVFFKFKNENKQAFMLEIKADLEALVSKIDELEAMEVGINFLEDESMPDFALTSSFTSMENLKVYANHPDHVLVVNKIKEMATERSAVDYIV